METFIINVYCHFYSISKYGDIKVCVRLYLYFSSIIKVVLFSFSAKRMVIAHCRNVRALGRVSYID